MLKIRTKLLLSAIATFGVGIGVLSSFADGAYSAICLFVLPVFVALAAAAIVSDFNSPTAECRESSMMRKARPEETSARVVIPVSRWTQRAAPVLTREQTSR